MALKIGFDAKRLFNNFTGLGNYSRTLVSNLQKFYPENEYHLFTNKITLTEETEEFTKPPYILHQPQHFLENILWRTAQQSKYVNKLGLDIYHGLSHEIPYGIDPKTKTIVTFHDLIYEKIPQHFSYWNQLSYHHKYKDSANRSDKIIAISKQTKTDLEQEYKITSEKIAVVYQSLGSAFTNHPVNESKGMYFLYVGSIIERKGLLRIIEAFSLLKEEERVPFYIIGEGGRYKEKCISLIKKKALEKWFIFKGNVDNYQLFEYYDNSIAVVLPSIYEGFGIPIIEALHRKKPVITSKNSAMSEAAGPGGLLIDPNNSKELASAMLRIRNEEIKINLVSNGYEYVTHHFNAEKTAFDLIEVYNAIIS